MNQIINTSSFFRNANPELKTLISNTAKEHGISQEEVVTHLFNVFLELIKKFKENNSTKTLTPERVSPEKKEQLDEFEGVPAIATLAEPPSDQEPELANLEKLSECDALNAINCFLHQKNALEGQILEIYQFFSKDGQFTAFLKLGSSPNAQFEVFLSAIKTDLDQIRPSFNDYKQLNEEVYNFAFSHERFEWIQLKNDEISPRLNEELKTYEKQCKEETPSLSSIIENMGKKYDKWLTLLIQGSSSLSNKMSKERWCKADALKTSYTKNPQGFELDQIKKIHHQLTKGEEGISKPGQFRQTIVKIGGGGATAVPPPNQLIEKMMSEYECWINDQRAKCKSGEKSIILTSAQAYQRLVSIHPFENGNGRVSRMMMNYVLESFEIPPAILGQDVLDAVFVLKPKRSMEENKAFIRKIFEGVQRSHDFIYGKAIDKK